MQKKSEPIRILQVVTHLNRNGLESRIMDIYRNVDRTKVQFDFMIHRNELGDFGEEIKSMGGRIYMMPRISPRNFVKYLSKLDDFFAKNTEYKIVHVHLNTLSTWVLYKAKKYGVPIRIAHSRNASMEKNFRALPKTFSKLFINFVTTDRFACSSMAGEWLFGKKYLNDTSFKVIPNAFDVDKFVWDESKRYKKRNELGIENEDIVYISVARLSEQKNHIYLLQIFEKIHKKDSRARLVLVGAGECEQKIKMFITEHYLQECVIMLGSRADVAELYMAADLFLFPSKYEGFGTVVIEAQVTHLPVLASDRIPSETKICDCVTFMSINDNVENWAGLANEMVNNSKRYDNSKIIRDAGFDIRKQYRWMENYYITKYEEATDN